MSEEIHFTQHVAIKVIEPAVLRPILPVRMAEMPLAHQISLVSRISERLRQGPLVGGQGRRCDLGRSPSVCKP